MGCLYNQSGELFEPTGLATSPWHPQLLHGASVAALFAWHLARWGNRQPAFRLTRLSLDLLRPVPMAPLRMQTQLIRDGQRLKLLAMELYAGERLVTRGESLWQSVRPLTLPDYAPRPEPAPRGPEGVPEFSIQQMLDDKGLAIPPGFHTHVCVRPLTPWNEQGQSTCWLHWPHTIVDDHPVSPLEQVCLLSDIGNGAGQLNFGNRVGAINADIILSLFRYPAGSWVALSSRALFSADGIGVVRSSVYDTEGEIGCILQSAQPNGEFDG